MTYSGTSIQAIVGRIGWADAVQPTAIVVSDENQHSDSGRLFNAFHKLATVENMAATISNSNNVGISDDTLNAKLAEMKEQAVRTVLQMVFDSNPRANSRENAFGTLIDYSGTDYSDVIESRAALFDDAYGKQLAIDAIGVILTTANSNMTQRLGMTAAQLKTEVEDVRTVDGVVLSTGLYTRRDLAIRNISNILWPLSNGRATVRDASYRW